MEFINGFSIKPKEILRSGQVVFTDGKDNNATPSQAACEAYGYTYDVATGTCRAYTYSMGTEQTISNETNFIKGTNNTTESATTNTIIMGQGNTTKGNNRSNIIIGSSNEIQNGVDNATVLGFKGNALVDNSIVLGGNQGADLLGERQAIHLMYGAETEAGAETASFLNNIDGNYFVVPENTILYYHADVIAVRVGGESEEGDVGDYASWVERGVIIDQRGVVTVNREKDAIKSNGTVTDWRPRGDAINTNMFTIMVRGETDTIIKWNCYIRMTQIKAGVNL